MTPNAPSAPVHRAATPDGTAPGTAAPGTTDRWLPRAARAVLRLAAELLLPAALLLARHLAAASGAHTRSQLPPPAAVSDAARDLAARAELAHHIAISTQRALLGKASDALLGLAERQVVRRWS